jgi:hypothetical protein
VNCVYTNDGNEGVARVVSKFTRREGRGNCRVRLCSPKGTHTGRGAISQNSQENARTDQTRFFTANRNWERQTWPMLRTTKTNCCYLYCSTGVCVEDGLCGFIQSRDEGNNLGNFIVSYTNFGY